jgi:hypothetical protein
MPLSLLSLMLLLGRLMTLLFTACRMDKKNIHDDKVIKVPYR